MVVHTTIVDAKDGRKLCVDSGGDPDGPSVLIHWGTPNSRLIYAPLLEDAARNGVHLLSYDRPGYGGSSPHPGRRVADCVEDVRAIAAAFGIDRMASWGISGGGPHVLACAALAPDLFCAVASLASIAPYGAEGLDFFAGMGQENVDDMKLYLADPDAARKKAEEDREKTLQATPEQFADLWPTLLSAADAAAMTPELAGYLADAMQAGLAPGVEGWWEDGVAHMESWGFDPAEIGIPMQLWHGAEDRFVPFQHGQWLAERIPGVDAHLTATDGHLTLLGRVPEIREWLLARF
ncbi:MAG: alpha/beta fold hydrolase [Acidimicrobiales bacterium]